MNVGEIMPLEIVIAAVAIAFTVSAFFFYHLIEDKRRWNKVISQPENLRDDLGDK